MLRAGQRLRTRLFDARRLESATGHVRIAIVVPKYQYSIVQRNKLKRRLRELTRLQILPQRCSCDLILRARHEAYEATFASLRNEVNALTAQLG